MSQSILDTLKSPFKFRLFLLRKVPLAFIAGVRLEELSEERASISVKHIFLTQNPFQSLYFACLAMAGELASGVLSSVHVNGTSVSMLVTHIDADFTKKAVGKIIFTCTDGKTIKETIEESKRTAEGKTVIATSVGIDEAGDKVAEFRVTWSFKPRKK